MNNAVKKHFIELLFFILLDFFTVSLCAKDFKILDTSNGLPDNTVKCFCKHLVNETFPSSRCFHSLDHLISVFP